MSEIPDDVGIQRHLTSLHIDYWLRNGVFHWRWWLLIILLLIFLLVWWKLTEKSRLHDTCLYALLMLIIAMGINEYGAELVLWDYPVDIIPIFPPLSSVNLISLPLVYSLVYQFFKGRKNFIIWVLIMTAAICFVLEPVLSLLGIYQLLKWNYLYNFVMYALAAMLTGYAANRARKEERNY